MVMNNLSGTTKSEMTFGSENKNVHATIKFEADSFRVLNKDGSLAYLHTAQGTTDDSAVTMSYLESQLKRIEANQDKITSSDEVNMVHYNNESGTLGINTVSADRIAGLTKNRVLMTDENGVVTTSTVAKGQLQKLPNVPDDTQAELDKKADIAHTHVIADVEDLQSELDSKALSEHTHNVSDIEGIDTLSVHHADYAGTADSAKTDPNGTPIADYVRNVTVADNKVTVTKGNGDVEITQYVNTVVPATESEDGKAGLVPAPCRADSGKFLSATGTWEKPSADLTSSGITITPDEINKLPEAVDEVTAKIDTLEETVTSKTDELSKTISNTEEKLQTSIDGKADATHTHTISEVGSLQSTLDNLNSLIDENGKDIGQLSALVDTKAAAEHTHEIDDVVGLQDALDEKALVDHTHTISQITDIGDAVVAEAGKAVRDQNGKILTDYVTGVTADGANLKVTHGDGSYTTVSVSTEGTYSEFQGATEDEKGTFGLVPAPNAGDQDKVLSGSGRWVDAPPADLGAAGIEASTEELNYMKGVTAPIQTQLDEKAAAVHTHTASEVTDFDTAAKAAVADEIGEKADSVHTHEMSDITGLENTLGEKADATHTHTISQITDIADASVAEATKATTDKNDKDITEYVSDVTSEENKIKVTKGDGSSTEIALPETKTYESFTGASAEAEGGEGLVPAPAMGDQDKFLKADGTWAVPTDHDTTYEVATTETAGLVKASSEVQVSEDGTMTIGVISQSKVENLENDFAKLSQATNKFEIVGGTFEDTLVSYRQDEIRVAYSMLTPWAKQEGVEDPNKYYMTMRSYAPDEATGFRAAIGDKVTDGEIQQFTGENAGTDEMGRKYIQSMLPVATYDDSDGAWTYLGSSSDGKFAGWYYTVEWYNAANKMIGTSTIRINLANEGTINQVTPSYMVDYAKVDHTHTASQITDLQDTINTAISEASVASAEEATKATQDKNGKDITEYVSDVALEDSSLKITKGDGSASSIELPEGTAYADFTGTTGTEAGKSGLVPAPQTTDAGKFLKSDGTWAEITIPDAPTDVSIATEETAGIVKASSEIAVGVDGAMNITAMDQSKVTGLTDSLAGKADSVHSHSISDVTDLQTTLDGKAAAEHTHEMADITDLDLGTAKVAEATKATQDNNGKALTEYVADVTSEDSKIKVTKGDGSSTEITLPEGTVYSNFTGASAEAGGNAGLVPAPAMGDQDKFLKADGTWGTPVDHDTIYEVATTETTGLVKASTEISVAPDGAMSIGTIAQSKVEGLETALADKANAEHGHTLEDITDVTIDAEQLNALPDAVAGKAEVDHTHTSSDITDLSDTIDAKLTDVVKTSDLASATVAEAGKVTNAVTVTFNGAPDSGVTFDGSEAKTLDITAEKVGAANATHTHSMDDITELSTTLEGKSNTGHTHTASEITDLQDKLDEKANITHNHAISDVTDLQTTLDSKLEESDLPIATADTTGMVKGSAEIQIGEDGVMTVTGIDQSKVTGLIDSLSGKADKVHTHTMSDITDLDLSGASVASADEATKATQDKNGKDITEYVSAVTSEENKIKVTKGDGSTSEITLPEGTIYSNFTGTTGSEAGSAGLVPAPQTTDANKFLKSDGTWADVTVDDATVEIATSEKAGIVKPSSEIAVDGEGTMTVTSIAQSKVEGLEGALAAKVNSTDFATTDTAGIVKASTEISVGPDGTMSIGTIEQAKINGLSAALEGKSNTGHTHTASEITDLASATVAEAGKVTNAVSITLNGGSGEGSSVTFDGSSAQTMDITAEKIGAAEATHKHEVTDINGLDTALSGKADSVHTHSTSDITGLDTALADKANATHTHAISEITDLQTTLDGKAASKHSHEISEVNGLQDALGTKLNSADLKVATTDTAGIVKGSTEVTVGEDGTMSVGTIAQSKVEGLVDDLGNKAAAEHTHEMADITDLDLGTAKVAEATKATQDNNGKALTEYISAVEKTEENKLKVTKGDGSSSEIDLPAGGTGVSDPFTGTDGETEGKAGLVPAPTTSDADKFLASDGTWKVVQGASGEVSIKYVSQVPSTAAVGGISEGYVAPSGGIDILDLIYKLLHPYVAPTITATMVPRNGGTVGVETTQTVTAVRVNLQKANGNKIMSYQVYDVDSDFDSHTALGELYADDYESGFAEGAQNVTLNSPYQIKSNTSHKYLTVRALDIDGNESVIKTAAFTFVETYYWGSAPEGTELTAEYIENDETKTSQASAKGTKVVAVNHETPQFVYFCAPKSYGEISLVKDQNNFDNTSLFTPYTELTINGREYYVYKNDAFADSMTFTFSY